MATKTSNYEFNKPEQNDFYDVDVQNENWDKVDEELSEFDDSGVTEDIKSFPDFLSKFVTGNKVAITLRNLKAGLQFVLHAGQIVNNCVTDNTGLPLSAAQGKVLKDLIDTTNNNLESGYLKIKVYNSCIRLTQKTVSFTNGIGYIPLSEIFESFNPAYAIGVSQPIYLESEGIALVNVSKDGNNMKIALNKSYTGTKWVSFIAIGSL